MYFVNGIVSSLALHVLAAYALFGIAFERPTLLSGGGGGGAMFVSLLETAQGDTDTIPEATSSHTESTKTEAISSPQVDSPLTFNAPKPIKSQLPNKKKINPVVQNAAPKPSVVTAQTDSPTTDSQHASSGVGLGPESAHDGSGGGFAGAGEGPQLQRNPKPEYPRAARLAKFEGRVVLEVLIDPEGDVTQAQVVKSSGRDDCDHAAQHTILNKWHFSPARINGIAIPWRERVAVSFQLR